MAMHMTMAMLFGTLIAVAAFRMPGARSMVIAAGVLFTALLWAVMQYGIWRAIDATAAGDFTPWVFAIAHWLFGLMAASWAALAIEDADPRRPGTSFPGNRPGRATGSADPATAPRDR
jgi:hypothetical protein